VSPAVETRAATLLSMVADLQEAIVRLEDADDDVARETIRRLRVVQTDILAALRLADK
jgi:hypothetical protein